MPARHRLALQVRSTFTQYAEVISAVILGSALINEVIGPVLTRLAIARAAEVREHHPGAFEAI